MAWQERHPNRAGERIAGTEAIYDGVPITRSHTVYDGFLERGWIADSDVGKICMADMNACTARFNGGQSQECQREDRWRLMMAFCADDDVDSLVALSNRMGFSKGDSITKFVRKYGRDLAKKLGKLPNVKSLKKGIWLEVMEQE